MPLSTNSGMAIKHPRHRNDRNLFSFVLLRPEAILLELLLVLLVVQIVFHLQASPAPRVLVEQVSAQNEYLLSQVQSMKRTTSDVKHLQQYRIVN